MLKQRFSTGSFWLIGSIKIACSNVCTKYCTYFRVYYFVTRAHHLQPRCHRGCRFLVGGEAWPLRFGGNDCLSVGGAPCRKAHQPGGSTFRGYARTYILKSSFRAFCVQMHSNDSAARVQLHQDKTCGYSLGRTTTTTISHCLPNTFLGTHCVFNDDAQCLVFSLFSFCAPRWDRENTFKITPGKKI